ncbi:MAG: cysteine--tRNA ligase [Bdellovibrionota bacterium]
MSIHLFNTLSAKKELLTPLSGKEIKMYCCGVTPYGSTHIGHSRTFFSYDLLYRTLKDQNYDVRWARNITDVDDKIINKANEEKTTCANIISRYVNEQNEMLDIFSLCRPQHEPMVTENILQIIQIIQKLIEKNYAYISNSGVYFRVRKFSEYGKLSKNKIDDLKTGARIEVDESKEDALDFALWKFAKPEEIFWSSPWGDGRPGWHVECSAMIHSIFGDSIDIHMGGRDLIFPHHEAEIAQSEAATGKPLASIWMHAGMVTLYGDKMSKSTNHYVPIKDFLTKYPPEVLRLVFLSVSYSQPLDFTFELVDENLKKLCKLYRFVALVDSYLESKNINTEKKECAQIIFSDLEGLAQKMRLHLCDDLNSGLALATMFNFIKTINSGLSKLEKLNQNLSQKDFDILLQYWPQFKNWIQEALGILINKPDEFFEVLRKYNLGAEISISQIEKKIEERKLARDNKNWIESDRIRDELLAQGIQIQDTPSSGTKWTVII